MFITTVVPNTLTLDQAWESGIWVKRIQVSSCPTLVEAKPDVGEAGLTRWIFFFDSFVEKSVV